MSRKVTFFEDLEEEKENYSRQKKGRSASLISHLKHSSEESQHEELKVYWRLILEKAQHMNDPLPLFLKYIELESHQVKGDWKVKRSKLVQVNELCLLYCQRLGFYKDDPRYFDVWLGYATNVYSNDDIFDVMVYMYRSNIATKLAAFYSNFADLLVLSQRFEEAYLLLKLGIQSNAEPQQQLEKELQDLERDYGHMIHGADKNIPISTMDQVVSGYNEPQLILNEERNSLIKAYQDRQTENHHKDGSNSTAIFQDNQQSDRQERNNNVYARLFFQSSESEVKFQPWSERLKENQPVVTDRFEPDTTIEPLKQQDLGSKTTEEKVPIYNDEMGRNGPIYKIIPIDGMKPEKIDCNFNLIFPENGPELSIEELLALSRRMERDNKKRDTTLELEAPHIHKKMKTVAG